MVSDDDALPDAALELAENEIVNIFDICKKALTEFETNFDRLAPTLRSMPNNHLDDRLRWLFDSLVELTGNFHSLVDMIQNGQERKTLKPSA